MAPPSASSVRLGPLKRIARRLGCVEFLLLLVWPVLGFLLSRLATKVVDWFVMTDELLYERLAISIVDDRSLLPRIHGVLVPNVSQLYPLLLATVYRHHAVPQALHDAHLLNAFIMSSALVPAYLIVRRASGSRWAAVLVALGTVCVPWILYSSFLLTEVVSYPAFLWAILAIEAAVVKASAWRDVALLAGLALAVAARVEFVVLIGVVPVALYLFELATGDDGPGRRPGRAARTLVARHRVLAVSYVLLLVGAAALLAVGRIASILGTYADTVEGKLLPNGLGRSLLAHVEVIALPLGILPFLVAGGWLLSSAFRPARDERYAFTVVALVAIVALWIEVTIFDLRFGGGIARDRYLFYVVPLLLAACACGLCERDWARRFTVFPALLAAGGFLVSGLPVFGTLDVDTPASDVDGYLRTSLHSLEGARLVLAGAAVIACVLYTCLSSLFPLAVSTAAVVGVLALVLPAGTWYAYATLFDHNGTSGRPLTLRDDSVFDWVDRVVGTAPEVTMLPYPFVPGDFQASTAYWWDLEFWNESVVHQASYPGEFEGTPSTFPKLVLRFNPQTGFANISPSLYAIELASETRFHIWGGTVYFDRGAYLIDTDGLPWRSAWLTFGLYDDGWTIPGVTATVRVFPVPTQVYPERRTLVVTLETPVAGRKVEIVSNEGRWSGRVASTTTPTVASVHFCLPPQGYTEIRLTVDGASEVWGDMRNVDTFGSYRVAGVLVSDIQSYVVARGTCSP